MRYKNRRGKLSNDCQGDLCRDRETHTHTHAHRRVQLCLKHNPKIKTEHSTPHAKVPSRGTWSAT
jgi:hypothetical protein